MGTSVVSDPTTGVTTPTHHGNGIYTFSGGQIPVGNDHWKLVRRVQAGSTWHPATDHLAGTTASGTYSTDLVSSSTFSIQFDELECSHFLFSTGDMQKWLVAAAEEVNGASYSNSPRTILRSSISSSSYTARWYNRDGSAEDPWISLEDHAVSAANAGILYGGNEVDVNGNGHTTDLVNHQGANVFCKVSGKELLCCKQE